MALDAVDLHFGVDTFVQRSTECELAIARDHMIYNIVLIGKLLNNVLVAPKSCWIEIGAVSRQLTIIWMSIDHAPRNMKIGRINCECAASGARHRTQVPCNSIEFRPFVPLEQ